MPPISKLSRIYLESGDEFTVTEYVATVAEWIEDHRVVFTENVRWRNPDADDADHLDDALPWHTVTPLAINTRRIIAVELVEPHVARIIDRAREHQAA